MWLYQFLQVPSWSLAFNVLCDYINSYRCLPDPLLLMFNVIISIPTGAFMIPYFQCSMWLYQFLQVPSWSLTFNVQCDDVNSYRCLPDPILSMFNVIISISTGAFLIPYFQCSMWWYQFLQVRSWTLTFNVLCDYINSYRCLPEPLLSMFYVIISISTGAFLIPYFQCSMWLYQFPQVPSWSFTVNVLCDYINTYRCLPDPLLSIFNVPDPYFQCLMW